jgi:hypothetical protein
MERSGIDKIRDIFLGFAWGNLGKPQQRSVRKLHVAVESEFQARSFNTEDFFESSLSVNLTRSYNEFAGARNFEAETNLIVFMR